MKQFDTFSEYMFDLLFAPLKKGRKTANQLRIFFKVMGREFDDLKAAIFRVRNEANVASCSEVMLPVHGQDRDMPRLEGEDAEAYRTRLSMKGIISQWSGTRRGVLYALTALGYDRSRIELFAEQDAERWAEFIIFLNSSKPSGVTNLSVIDAQVRKVKEGSSKPAYGMETIGGLIIQSRLQTGFSRYPRCGEIVCGVWPHMVIECSVSVPPAPPSSAAAVETVKINSPCGRSAAEERRQRSRRNEHAHEETNDIAVGSRAGALSGRLRRKGRRSHGRHGQRA